MYNYYASTSIKYVQFECEYICKIRPLKPHETSLGEGMQSLIARSSLEYATEYSHHFGNGYSCDWKFAEKGNLHCCRN